MCGAGAPERSVGEADGAQPPPCGRPRCARSRRACGGQYIQVQGARCKVQGEGDLVVRQSRRKSAWAAAASATFAALLLIDLRRTDPSTVQLAVELPGVVLFGLGAVALAFIALRPPIL